MSTVIVRRTERRDAPELPGGEIKLQSPPEIPEVTTDGFRQTLMYLPMLVMTVGMTAAFAGNSSNKIMYVAGGAMVLGMGGMVVAQMGRGSGDRKIKLNGLRRDYLRYLGQVRRKVREIATAQREALEWVSPPPRALPSLLVDPELRRVWERRPSGDDFAKVRIGTGTHRLAVRLVPPETKPVEDLDPLCAGALRRFVRAHNSVPGLPVGISLRAFARIAAGGEREAVYGMLRAMIAQIAIFHSPDDVRISVCASRERISWWQWIKWLPHNMHPGEIDAAGPVRLMAPVLPQLEALIGAEFAGRPQFTPGRSAALPFHIVIIDGGEGMADSRLGTDGIEGAVLIDLSPDAMTTPGTSVAPALRLHVTSGGTEMITRDRTGAETRSPIGVADFMSLAEADAFARQMAPLRPRTGGPADDPLAADTTLTALLGISSPFMVDVGVQWRQRPPRARLRVPIGSDADGQPVDLDIKESAQGGMGPHGLVVGATGSGKSELLRTLVLGLAVTHSPDTLNFVLVDFKGGATFLGLEGLTHVSAVITNLADELPLVDRMREALNGELVRRQELLRTAGNYASLRDYTKAREQGADLPPVPSLFVVIDEFSELLSARPEFIDVFVTIGRVGRSLGVHLLLASQRLEEGRLRGLDTQLSYRIGLRTFSAAESRVVLGVPDAYELPPHPGNGYLKTGTEDMTRFKAAYVSGPAVTGPARTQHRRLRPMIVPFGPGYVRPELAGDDPQPQSALAESAMSVLDAVVGQLAGHGPAAHQIWLPPLDVPPTLDQLLPPLSITPQFGCSAEDPATRGKLRAITGIVDRPFEQRRDPLLVDLSAGAGHAAVVGAPRSGKSTMLRTLICSLALLHTPQETQFYCLDFGGGAMGGLATLPHVGGVAARLDAVRVRRTVAEVQAVLTRREREFAERGIESIAAYRRMRASGEITGDGFGDVFLVVDGWLTLRQDFEALEQMVTAMAARGLGYGVHVLASAGKWSEFRPAVRDLFGTRMELRLGDPYESEIDRKLAANVPESAPGRGITKDGLHFLTALPRIDSQPDADSLADGVQKLAETVAVAWQADPAPPVRLLPDVLPVSALPGAAQTGTKIPFAVDESTLAPVLLDFGTDAHLLVFGDTECGKSNLLRLIAESVVERYTPDQARLIFIDYRRSLIDSSDSEHTIGYAASSAAAAPIINDVREAMTQRLPPPDLTPQQLRSRSWWKGSDLFLVIDDYDLVSGTANPLLAIVDLVAQARDIGLHLIIARSAGGGGRALFDPIIQRVREMGSPGLIMSGSKDEGALIGSVKAQPQPQGRGFFVERKSGSQLVQVALLDDGTMAPTGQHHAVSAPAAPNGYGSGVPAGHAAPHTNG
ncbi:MAG TPA: type VII secretion protein EccCa [Streptosporangiaceae bacterium]|nr:type VII secretion protein EccCa [Streptosporangiaceae bacterium]